jgi:hypothetical protein
MIKIIVSKLKGRFVEFEIILNVSKCQNIVEFFSMALKTGM